MKISQSEDQLKRHLIEQIGFIQKSSKMFDGGDVSEAKRIAIHLRILLHDTRNSKSLLLTLGDKDKICFLNSASEFYPRNLMPYFGLVFMRMINDSKGFRGEYVPKLEEYLKTGGEEDWRSLNDWWEGLIIKDQQKNMFSRRELVLHVADTDGGAHVDKSLDKNYISLSRGNSLGFHTIEKRPYEVEQRNNIKHIELASIRQIAFEVISSLTKYYPILTQAQA